jgi:hypothetical protein
MELLFFKIREQHFKVLKNQKCLDVYNDVLYHHTKSQPETLYIFGLTNTTKSNRIWTTDFFYHQLL